VQPEGRVPVGIAELVLDVDKLDPVTTGIAHRAGSTIYFEVDGVLRRQAEVRSEGV
jgi:hypothetical protein